MKNTWISIPTYWGDRGTSSHPASVHFDHPSALDEEGTLLRTLSSLNDLNGDFTLLLIVGVSHREYAERAHEKVKSIVHKAKAKYPVYMISPHNLAVLNQYLNTSFFELRSYGTIRNVQLLFPYLCQADIVVGIDDDEIIPDTNYLQKTQHTGSTIDGSSEGDFIWGMAGPYYSGTGEWKIPVDERLASHHNHIVRRGVYLERAVSLAVTDPAPIAKRNVAFGGNMCFSRELISKACHDPNITRGEDYDFVLNAKMEGCDFYFQPAMQITHLPPDSKGAGAGNNVYKLVNDIKRFAYFRNKLDYIQSHYPEKCFDLEYMQPYPGAFLNPDIDFERDGIEALTYLYPEYCKEHDIVSLVQSCVQEAAEMPAQYFEYLSNWKQLLASYTDVPAATREQFRL